MPSLKKLINDSYVIFKFNSCLFNVQIDLHRIFLILRIRIYCMINIERSFLLLFNLCVTKQVGIRRFS